MCAPVNTLQLLPETRKKEKSKLPRKGPLNKWLAVSLKTTEYLWRYYSGLMVGRGREGNEGGKTGWRVGRDMRGKLAEGRAIQLARSSNAETVEGGGGGGGGVREGGT